MKSSLQKFITLTILAFCASGTITQCSKKDSDLSVQSAVAPQTDTSKVAKDGERCTSHTMCGPGAACVLDKCQSIDNISCQSDLDCPEFDRCYNGGCAACASDTDCAPGFTCNAHGVCVP